jgi:hypothetical protein
VKAKLTQQPPPHCHQVPKGKAQQQPPLPQYIPEEPKDGEDPHFISDTNKLIKISQTGPERHDIRDTDMGGAITYALMDLEGVDTEPDINDVGKKGPWIMYATEDCATQFEAKYGNSLVFTINGLAIKFTVTYESINMNDDTGGFSTAAASKRAIASAMSDISTNMVIKITDNSIAGQITIGILNKACARSNIKMLKGNCEKRKINTNSGLINT